MTNGDGSLWIVYNGKAYNYRKLRGDPCETDYEFTSKTDTEVGLQV